MMIKPLQQYLSRTLHVHVSIEAWKPVDTIPLFLLDMYELLQLTISQTKMLLMVPLESHAVSPAQLQEHMAVVGRETDLAPVVGLGEITARDRDRLIERALPFVIQSKHIYLPFMGMDLRDNFRSIKQVSTRLFPAAQVTLLHILQDTATAYTPKDLALKLGYSQMTLSRVFDQFAELGIGWVDKDGRTRRLEVLPSRKEIWDRAKNHLWDPLRVKRYVIADESILENSVVSGRSALAYYVDLPDPVPSVRAMDRATWRKGDYEHSVELFDSPEPGTTELELWAYDPRLLTRNHVTDKLSLYLRLGRFGDDPARHGLSSMISQLFT